MTSAPTLEVTTEPPPTSRRSASTACRSARSPARGQQVNKLIAATARLRLFRELRAAVGTAVWPNVHRALCAGLQPRVAADGELIFHGLHTLKSPLLVLHGEATLLAMPRPDVPPEEAAALRPGDCLAAASLTWLQPLTTTAVARGRVQLLALPPDVYHQHCKLPHLQLLQQRALLLGRLPLLRGCGDTALRALAYSAERHARPPRAALLREGTPCTGLAVLASGSASVTVQLHKVGVGDGDDGGEASAAVAHIAAPELLGVIDVLSAVLDRGREARRDTARREAAAAVAAARSGGPRLAPRGEALTPSPSSSSAAARKAAAPVTATHGASVVASTHRELLEVRTEELRHCPERSLLELAAAADARGSVREVLRHEHAAAAAAGAARPLRGDVPLADLDRQGRRRRRRRRRRCRAAAPPSRRRRRRRRRAAAVAGWRRRRRAPPSARARPRMNGR